MGPALCRLDCTDQLQTVTVWWFKSTADRLPVTHCYVLVSVNLSKLLLLLFMLVLIRSRAPDLNLGLSEISFANILPDTVWVDTRRILDIYSLTDIRLLFHSSSK